MQMKSRSFIAIAASALAFAAGASAAKANPVARLVGKPVVQCIKSKPCRQTLTRKAKEMADDVAREGGVAADWFADIESGRDLIQRSTKMNKLVLFTVIRNANSLNAMPATAVNATIANLHASDAAETRTDDAIDALINLISRGAKGLPLWAVDTALNAYSAYQSYRNGERIDEIERTTLAILRDIAALSDKSSLSDAEFRRIRERLDIFVARLDDLTNRVASIESENRRLKEDVRTCRVRTRKLERRFGRPDCGYLHAWRNGRCVNVANNPH